MAHAENWRFNLFDRIQLPVDSGRHQLHIEDILLGLMHLVVSLAKSAVIFCPFTRPANRQTEAHETIAMCRYRLAPPLHRFALWGPNDATLCFF